MFRALRADEIELRVGSVPKSGKGFTLLCYKDSRCDQNILDETVGAMNWQRHHNRDNKNCVVSIWDKEKGQWIEKEDTGVESDTQAEKGVASDSFKRACFNWGIGRELYTSPFIWIPGHTSVNSRGKAEADARFVSGLRVSEVSYSEENGRKVISRLVIVDSDGNQVYSYGKRTARSAEPARKPLSKAELVNKVEGICVTKGFNKAEVLKQLKIESFRALDEDKLIKTIEWLMRK